MSDEGKNKKLKAEAQRRLKSLSKFDETPTFEEAKAFIHELKVHQIELEMQNEELRQAQLQLEESRDQYSDLFEFAPLGYFILNKNGLILNCNLTACTMLKKERSLVVNKPFSIFVSNESESKTKFRNFVSQVFQKVTLSTCEVLLKGTEDRVITARLDAQAQKDEKNKLTQIRMSVTDITKEKKAEQIQSLVEAVFQGQEGERERIAAELHDGINPLLSIAHLNADSLLSILEKNKNIPKEKIESIISLLEHAMHDIKEISSNLSPSLLKTFGLEKALEQLCDRVSQSGKINVEYLSYQSEYILEFEIELALFRIAQELLNNILKHAEATEVEVQLISHIKSTVLMVTDNGIGFEKNIETIKTNGFGLKNVTSRVESLNGSVSIDTVKNKGTTVTVECPN